MPQKIKRYTRTHLRAISAKRRGAPLGFPVKRKRPKPKPTEFIWSEFQ